MRPSVSFQAAPDYLAAPVFALVEARAHAARAGQFLRLTSYPQPIMEWAQGGTRAYLEGEPEWDEFQAACELAERIDVASQAIEPLSLFVIGHQLVVRDGPHVGQCAR